MKSYCLHDLYISLSDVHIFYRYNWASYIIYYNLHLTKSIYIYMVELGDGVQWRQDLEKRFKDVRVGRIVS